MSIGGDNPANGPDLAGLLARWDQESEHFVDSAAYHIVQGNQNEAALVQEVAETIDRLAGELRSVLGW